MRTKPILSVYVFRKSAKKHDYQKNNFVFYWSKNKIEAYINLKCYATKRTT